MADETDLLASVYAQIFDGEDIDTPGASTSSLEPVFTPSMTTISQPSYGIAAAHRALASMRLSPPKSITDAAPAAHSDTLTASDPFKDDTPKSGDILTFGPLQGVIDPNGDPNLKPRPYETSPVLDNGELSDELIEPHGGPNLKPRPYSTSTILDDMELGDESTIRTESARGAGTRRNNTGDDDGFMAVPSASATDTTAIRKEKKLRTGAISNKRRAPRKQKPKKRAAAIAADFVPVDARGFPIRRTGSNALPLG